MKTRRRRVEVNLDELDRVLDQAREEPLSETDCEKVKSTLHALAAMLVRPRNTEKTSAVLPEASEAAGASVNYFAIGHSSRCFGYIRDWVEKKIRRYLARAAQRQGFGWKRWSREWLYGTLGLFYGYRVSHPQPSPAASPS